MSFTENDLIRMYFRVARRFAALDIKVHMIHSELSGGERPPRKCTYAYVISEIMGKWLSFEVFDESIPIHLGTATPAVSTALDARILALEVSLREATAQIKVAQAAAGSHPGSGRGT